MINLDNDNFHWATFEVFHSNWEILRRICLIEEKKVEYITLKDFYAINRIAPNLTFFLPVNMNFVSDKDIFIERIAKKVHGSIYHNLQVNTEGTDIIIYTKDNQDMDIFICLQCRYSFMPLSVNTRFEVNHANNARIKSLKMIRREITDDKIIIPDDHIYHVMVCFRNISKKVKTMEIQNTIVLDYSDLRKLYLTFSSRPYFRLE